MAGLKLGAVAALSVGVGLLCGFLASNGHREANRRVDPWPYVAALGLLVAGMVAVAISG